jgi:hypothetical protein
MDVRFDELDQFRRPFADAVLLGVFSRFLEYLLFSLTPYAVLTPTRWVYLGAFQDLCHGLASFNKKNKHSKFLINGRITDMSIQIFKRGEIQAQSQVDKGSAVLVLNQSRSLVRGFRSDMPPDQFGAFVLRCFGAVVEEHQPGIHGMKGAVPVWVGESNPRKGVTAADVQDFANAIRRTLRYQQDNLRDGIMLAWAFRPDAVEAADRLRRLEQTDLNFIRLDMIRIDSPRFREHVTALSTQNADYENFLTFVQPPRVEVGYKRIAPRTYKFDVSETVVMNAGAKIINVQWDFDYGKRFSRDRKSVV